MNNNNSKRKFLLAAMVFAGLSMTTQMNAAYADDPTPTRGAYAAYTITGGTADNHNFTTSDGSTTSYYKTNISPLNLLNNINDSTVWIEGTQGNHNFSVVLPNSETRYFIYGYTKPDGWGDGERQAYDYNDNAAGNSAFYNNRTFNGLNSLVSGGAIDIQAKYKADAGHGSNFIGTMTADFVNNSITNLNTSEKGLGGALHIWGPYAGIETLNSNFINNHITYSSTKSGGGALAIGEGYNQGELTVGLINGNFINNYIDAPSNNFGGAIYYEGSSYGDGKITSIGQDPLHTTKFVGNYIKGSGQGGAIYAVNTIGSIYADFIGNYIAGSSDNSRGGAISLGSTSNEKNVGLIVGDFIGNYVTTSANNATAWGGAIYNNNIVGSITGDFLGNYVVSKEKETYGGAIYNTGTIGTEITGLTGNFIGNYANGNNVYGGAIYNTGTITNINGKFIENDAYVNAQYGYNAVGGAIANKNNGVIQNISGDFIRNKAHTFYTSNSSMMAVGGAIYNEGSKIGTINANFIENEAQRQAGAIYNNGNSSYNKGIGTISGNFIKNKVTGEIARELYGGAIFNEGTIGDITANFTSNSTQTQSDSNQYYNAYGGAIANNGSDSSLGDITGVFDGNSSVHNFAKVETGNYYGAFGGAIYNNGGKIGTYEMNEYDEPVYTGGIKSSTFQNNKAESNQAAQGGAIWTNRELNLIDTSFVNNSAISSAEKSYGGAIYAKDYNSSFENLGVIKIKAKTANVIFSGNKAENGAAIYSESNGGTFISAEGGNILFENNNKTGAASGTGTGIYTASTLFLNTGNEHTITINDNIDTSGGYGWGYLDVTPAGGNIYLNGSITTGSSAGIRMGYSESDGALVLGQTPANQTFNSLTAQNDSTLSLQNNHAGDNLVVNTFTGSDWGSLKFNIDYDATANSMDKITVNSGSGTITLNAVNVMNDNPDFVDDTEATYLDGTARNNITVRTEAIQTTIAETAVYTFTPDLETHGLLTVTRGAAPYEGDLINAIQDNVPEVHPTAYSMHENFTADRNFGVLNNENRASFTIFGNNHTISGDNNTYTGIEVANGDTLNIDNVNFSNVKTFDIQNEGVLNLSGTNTISKITDTVSPTGVTNITGGTTTISANGSVTQHAVNLQNGRLVVGDGATVNKIASTADYASVKNVDGGDIQGGAINNAGTISDITGTFANNIAQSSGNYNEAQGGAIYNSGSITTINADFTANQANQTGNNNNYVYDIAGGAIQNNDGTINTITGTFEGNSAKNDNSKKGVGGAISNEYDFSNTQITNLKADFISNEAYYGGAISNYSSTFDKSAVISAVSGKTDGNKAQFTNNVAYCAGGAIYNNSSTINSLNADFTNNKVEGYLSSNGIYSYGGAIYNQSVKNTSSISNMTGKFEGNHVSSVSDGLDAKAFGGAIFNVGSNNYKANLNNITGSFVGNYAYAENSFSTSAKQASAYGGAIYNHSNGVIDAIATDFTGNYTKAETPNSATTIAEGGAIYNAVNGSIGYISGVNFGGSEEGNVNYAVANSTNGHAYGGAIYNAGNIGDIEHDVYSISASRFEGNYVSSPVGASGGAIYSTSDLYIVNTDFVSNKAMVEYDQNSKGGAIYQDGGTLLLEDSSFIGNIADKGAAIYANNTDLTVYAKTENVEFTNNNSTGDANGSGTGLYLYDGSLTLNADESHNLTINDTVASTTGMTVNAGGTHTGTVILNSALTLSGTTTVEGGTLQLGTGAATSDLKTVTFTNTPTVDLQNSSVQTLTVASINGNATIGIDLDFTGTDVVSDAINITTGGQSGILTINAITALPSDDDIRVFENVPVLTGETAGVTIQLGGAITSDPRFSGVEHEEITRTTDDYTDTATFDQFADNQFTKQTYAHKVQNLLNIVDGTKLSYSSTETVPEYAKGDPVKQDVLQALNQSTNAVRSLSATDGHLTYTAAVDLGATGAGQLSVGDANYNATINMNSKSGFELSNEGTTLSLTNLNITNIKDTADGELINITGENSSAVLTNVIAAETTNSAIVNNRALTLAGNTTLNTGVKGTGTTYVSGNVTANKTVAQDIEMQSGKLTIGASDVGGKITNTLGSSTDTTSGIVLNAGTLTMAIEGQDSVSNNAGLTKLAGDVTVGAGGSIKQSLVDLDSYHLTVSADNLNNSGINGVTGSIFELTGGDYQGSVAMGGKILTSSDTTNINSFTLSAIQGWENNVTASLDLAPVASGTTYIQKMINLGNGVENNGTLTLKGFEVASITDIQNVPEMNFDVTMGVGEENGILNFERGHINLGLRGGLTPRTVNITQKNINVKNGASMIARNAVLNANINIENGGYAVVDADTTNGAVVNDGTLNIAYGSALSQNITGTGTTSISSAVTNNAAITQTDLIISGSLSTPVDNLTVTNAVQNGGTLTLTGTGDNANAISNYSTYEGKTVIAGTINNTALINQAVEITGTLTSTSANLGGTITNAGTLNLSGDLDKAIAGNGTTVAQTNMQLGTNASVAGTFDMNGKVFTMSGDNVASTFSVGTLDGNASLAIDLLRDSSSAIIADAISATTYTSGKTITVTTLNDMLGTSLESFTVNVLQGTPTGVALALDSSITGNARYQTSVENKQKAIDLIADATWDDTYGTERWTVTITRNITASDGQIVFTQSDPQESAHVITPDGDTLVALNQNIGTTFTDRSFTTTDATKIHTLGDDLGTTGAGSLTVTGATDGTNTSTINLDGHEGFTLGEGASLVLDTVIITGAKTEDSALINNTAGNVSLNNVEVAANASDIITNNGVMNVANSTVNTTITGANGTTNVTGNTVIDAITQNTVDIASRATLQTETVTASNQVSNAGGLTITGTANTSKITGEGSTTFTNNIINSGEISQSSLEVASGKTLTTTADVTTNTLTNGGTVTLNSADTELNINGTGTVDGTVNGIGTTVVNGNVQNNGTIATAVNVGGTGAFTTDADNVTGAVTNNGQVSLTSGDIQNNISGTGTTNITGAVTNTTNSAINNNINVEATGDLTTSADNIGGAVTSAGTVQLDGGTLNQTITGGNISVINDVTTNADNLGGTTNVAGAKELTLTGGNVNADIAGAGNTTITGAVTNNANIATATEITGGSVDNTNGQLASVTVTSGSLKSNADNILGTVTNADTYEITGGTIANDIVGSGNVNISGNTTINTNVTSTGNVSVAPNTELVVGNNATQVFANANSVELNNGSTLNTMNGGTTPVVINNIQVATDATANLQMDFGDVVNSATGDIDGNISVTKIDLSNTDGSSTSYAFSNLGNQIGFSRDLEIVTSGTSSNFVKYDATTGSFSSKRSNLQNAVDDTGAGKIATYAMDADETAGNDTLTGTLKVAGNGTAITGGGIVVGDGTTTGSDLILENVSVKNVSATQDAALYVNGGNRLEVNATSSDVKIEGTSGTTNAIYLNEDANGTADATLFADNSKTIEISDDIRSNSANNKLILSGNGDIKLKGVLDPLTVDMNALNAYRYNHDIAINWNLNAGTLHYSNDAFLSGNGNTINFNGGSLDIINGAANNISLAGLNVNANSNIFVDVDAANQVMDTLSGSAVTAAANLNVAGMNIYGTPTASSFSTKFVDASLGNTALLGHVTSSVTNVDTGIYQYKVSYVDDGTTGKFQYNVNIGPNVTSSYSPSVFASSVAMQGAYLSQLQNYDSAFGNLDQTMLMTREQRNALKYGNKYASNDETNPQIYSPLYSQNENKGIWFRPYVSFERVNLSGGPDVNNVMYGSLVGGDTDIIQIGNNGWESQISAYAGYNGSHQTYEGIGIYQNGGLIGATAALYKGNFFTALTANVGASSADIKTPFGRNDLTMLTTGLASKTGYNWELCEGRLILQPSWTMSYTFLNPFNNYTMANGVRIENSAVNSIQLVPGFKVIGNLPHGWQPYLGVNMRWNILDNTKVKASYVGVPETSVDPYVEYGIGLQKLIGDRFTGFAQAMLRNGGRNGVSFTFGFRWALGGLTDKQQTKSKNTIKTTDGKKLKKQLNNINK